MRNDVKNDNQKKNMTKTQYENEKLRKRKANKNSKTK